MPDYAEFLSVVANEQSKAVELSGSSIALLLTALGEGLENTLNWRGSGEFDELTQAEKDQVDEIIALAERELMTEMPNQLPYFAHLFHFQNIASVGNAIAILVNTSNAHNHISMQNTPALNDEWISPQIWLRAGNYELSVNYIKNNQSGRLRLFWNGEQLAEEELYSPSALYNQIVTYEVSSVGAANQVSGLIYGKHTSSSSYRCMISDIWLRKLSFVG